MWMNLVIPSLKLTWFMDGTSIGKAIDLSFEIIEKQLSSYASLGISATKLG
jgi:hypothetical protein